MEVWELLFVVNWVLLIKVSALFSHRASSIFEQLLTTLNEFAVHDSPLIPILLATDVAEQRIHTGYRIWDFQVVKGNPFTRTGHLGR